MEKASDASVFDMDLSQNVEPAFFLSGLSGLVSFSFDNCNNMG